MRLAPVLFVAYADQAAERQMNEAFLADARTADFTIETLVLHGGHTFPMVEQGLPPAFSFLEHALGATPPSRLSRCGNRHHGRKCVGSAIAEAFVASGAMCGYSPVTRPRARIKGRGERGPFLPWSFGCRYF